MKYIPYLLSVAWALAMPLAASAQVEVRPAPDQQLLLKATDPVAAAHKKLVYDFWRQVLEAGHLELAESYLTADYIQHNPMVPTGREGFVNYFAKFRQKKPVAATIKAPLVAMVAEGNLVVLSFVQTRNDPQDASKTYTTTWFDMFRIENGKIAEHWDSALKE